MISVKSMTVFALAAVAAVSPAAAETRMRRPRGERDDSRRERREREEDAPRLRDGIYGDEAGAYGDIAGVYGDEPILDSIDKPVVDPVEEPVVEPVDEPAVDAVDEPADGPISAHGDEPVVDNVDKPDADTGDGVCDLSIADAVAATPDLSTLGVAIETAGLTDAVSDPASVFTVLAPTNGAFAAVDENLLSALLENPAALSAILSLHIIDGAAVFSSELEDGMVVATLSGLDLTVGVSAAGVTFTTPEGTIGTVVVPDVEVCSSVVHIINTVLI